MFKVNFFLTIKLVHSKRNHMSNKSNTGSDIQGLTRLITDATIGLTDVVEAIHKRVIHPPFLPSTPIQYLISNIASLTYKNVRRTTQFIGEGLDRGIGQLTPLFKEIKTTDEREAFRCIINGVVGDYLGDKENPLKITMQLRYQSKAMELDQKSIKEAYPTINGKILLMVHGSCLGDFQWTRKGHNHGEKLAEEFNKTPIYLNYNSGLHVSTNGQRFSELLEELVNNWPVPVEEIIIVSHSMGGLVARSAFYYGNKGQKTWTKYLKKVVFMGTPHHGSQLERTGNYVDVILNSIHYTKPFARLGKIRSAGVTDLRYGNLIDEDWNGNDRFERTGDQRASLPLPEEVDFYSIAAVTGKKIKSKSNRILGDGLVNIKSALGEHVNPAKNLHLKKASKLIVYETAHIDLLSSLTVYAKLKEWLI